MAAALRRFIALRVPPEAAELIQQAATLDNRSVNQWATLRLVEAAKREVKEK